MKPVNYYFLNAFLMSIVFLAVSSVSAQDKRAMNLEDIMNFKHMHTPSISHDGRWVAYYASPDRGDGYGVAVSSDNKIEFRIERAEAPIFSPGNRYILFTLKPPFSKTEKASVSEPIRDGAVLIDTSDGGQTHFNNLKRAGFTTLRDIVLIHHDREKDSTITEDQNNKLKSAGTPLFIKDLNEKRQITIPFVDKWTTDSLSTTLVFTIKDTVPENNGMYYISLDNANFHRQIIDTAGNFKFDGFSWFEKQSVMAYMKAAEMETDTAETAELFIWQNRPSGTESILKQTDSPGGYFLPFDNDLTWSNDGKRLFFGFRPDKFASGTGQDEIFRTVVDSIQSNADVDVWHGNDPLIKTHEKRSWNRVRSQNLLSVYNFDEDKYIQLADEYLPDVQPSLNGQFALGWTSVPYNKRITWEGFFRDIYTIDLNTGKRDLIAEELYDIFSISPDANYILYFDKEHWHLYDIQNKTHTNLTSGLDIPFYNETHDLPSPPSGYRMAGWIEGSGSALVYDRFDIWKVDPGSGILTNITDGSGRSGNKVFRIIKLDDKPQFGADEPLFLECFNEKDKTTSLYKARPDRQGVALLKHEDRRLRLRLLSGNGNMIVYSRESYDEFPDLWITNTLFEDPLRISDMNAQIEGFNWGTSELLSFHSADGVPLQGVVIKPGDYDPSRSYPVFVYYYEKFSQRLHEFNQTVINHRPSFGYYASNGYVVFLPDIHFKDSRPGISAVNSLVPAVQRLIDTGIADPDAIGLHGHSWSGYQTAFVVTKTDIFKAAIAGAPVSNMTSAYGGIRWGSGMARQFQYETGQSRLGSSVFEKRYLYIENSPLFYAHEINTPLLIMHGDDDEAVPWEQSIELYLAMRRAGGDIIFLQYRDEPHHLQKYANKVDYTVRMKEYFDYHLKGQEPAGWIKEGVPYSGN